MEPKEIDFDELIYQKEINIGFFNYDKDQFNEMIDKLIKSSFSKKFELKYNSFFYNEYTKVSFVEKKEIKNEIIYDDEDEIEENNIIINLNNCEFKEKKDKIYDNYIKEKLDFYFIFNDEIIDKNFLEKIHECSKQNYIIFNMGKDINKDIINIEKYLPYQYDFFSINKEDIEENEEKSKTLIFNDFLIELIDKFKMFKIFQKYSIEKSIISFKDYLYNFNKYNKISDENELIELFNKFEKFSFNNDYADITIILLQIMTTNKNIFNNNFTFNARTLECGFCLNKINECEFDNDSKSFLCFRCRFAKENYPGK